MEKFDCFSLLGVPVLTQFDDWHFYVNCKPDPVLAQNGWSSGDEETEAESLIWCQGRKGQQSSQSVQSRVKIYRSTEICRVLIGVSQSGPVTNKRSIGWGEVTRGRWLQAEALSCHWPWFSVFSRPGQPGRSEPSQPSGNKSALRHNTAITGHSLGGDRGGIKLDRVTQPISQSLSHHGLCCSMRKRFINESKNEWSSIKILIGRSTEECWSDSSSGYWFLFMDGDLVELCRDC